MKKAITKEIIVHAIETLPEDATLDDAIDRLVFLHEIEKGLQDVREGKTISLEEFEAHFERRWMDKQPA